MIAFARTTPTGTEWTLKIDDNTVRGAIRVSPHVYNDGNDIERLIEALRRLIA